MLNDLPAQVVKRLVQTYEQDLAVRFVWGGRYQNVAALAGSLPEAVPQTSWRSLTISGNLQTAQWRYFRTNNDPQ